MVVVLMFAAYILLQRRKRRRAAAISEQEKGESYIEGQENERNRLAKELHDGVSNQLFAVEMKLNLEGLTPQTMQMLSESREQVRRVSHELYPPEFEYTNIDEAIRHYILELDGTGGCEITYSASPADADWTTVPKEKALEIYRIIQEVAGNVLKHSGATEMAIGMQMSPEQTITIIISDNGTAHYDDNSNRGIGSRTIRQRTRAIGGKMEYSHEPFGNIVTLTVSN